MDIYSPEPVRAVLVGAAGMSGEAEQALALAGGELAERVDWRDAASAIERLASAAPVLLVEAEGADTGLLGEVMPRLAAAVAEHGLQAVIALDAAAIDLVAAAWLGHDVQLLCAPSLAERVAAIAIAARAGAPRGRRVEENERERLGRLSDEVARIAELLARLVAQEERRTAPVDQVGDRRLSFTAAPDTASPRDAERVRRAIRSRRLRDSHFGSGLFEDPAWDMLLDLFAAEIEGIEVAVSSLCIAAAVAPTTALRWIGRLIDAGLFERHPDPADGRRVLMALTAKASEAMRAYVAAVTQAGLPIA